MMENISEIERLTQKIAELQGRAEEAEQREQKAEEELQETTLTEYLSLCHNICPSRYLFRPTSLSPLKEIPAMQMANSVRTIYSRGKTFSIYKREH